MKLWERTHGHIDVELDRSLARARDVGGWTCAVRAWDAWPIGAHKANVRAMQV